jgi:hypothetical protein
VLLPDPDGPITAVNVPRRTPTVTPSSAVTAPSPVPYTFRTASSPKAHAPADLIVSPWPVVICPYET